MKQRSYSWIKHLVHVYIAVFFIGGFAGLGFWANTSKGASFFAPYFLKEKNYRIVSKINWENADIFPFVIEHSYTGQEHTLALRYMYFYHKSFEGSFYLAYSEQKFDLSFYNNDKPEGIDRLESVLSRESVEMIVDKGIPYKSSKQVSDYVREVDVFMDKLNQATKPMSLSDALTVFDEKAVINTSTISSYSSYIGSYDLGKRLKKACYAIAFVLAMLYLIVLGYYRMSTRPRYYIDL